MILLQLFYEFFKIGLFSVGGGLATLPFLYDLSERKGWFTRADVADMLAISESTPGAIGVNMSTYVGYSTAGISGGIVATIALVLPSIIIIILIAKALKKFQENKLVQSGFYGLRPASTALVAAAGLEVCKITLLNIEKVQDNLFAIFNWKSIILAIILFYGIEKYKKHPIFYIVIAACIGIIFNFSS